MANYEVVIGLEVHVELKTKTKIFCSCPNEFGLEPNTNVCPICLGLPGSLPLLNAKVLEYAVKAGIAVNCDILKYSEFDRKNYFYPDLPKAYQISQFHYPICKNGYLDIEVDGETKRIGITQIHMEEDAGKLVHQGSSITDSDTSLADYNRGGVPLIEIVSEPDMRSAEEARIYLEKLKSYIEYTGVSDVKMEEGSLRCDANVSVRPLGQKEFGTRAEVKNLNSFRAVQRAIEYEVERQIAEIEDGGRIIQETRTWDDNQGVTRSLRSKEGFSGYRYFPDPDLSSIVIDEEYIENLKKALPELPDARKDRLVKEQGLSDYDASIITSTRAVADFHDQTVELFNDPKTVSNWIMGEFMKLLNEDAIEITDSKIKPEALAKLLELIDKGTISGKIAKTVFEDMFESGKDPAKIVEEKGLTQISDEGELTKIIENIIANNPKSVEDFKSGKGKAIGFLVGQVMKETKGQANPKTVNEILQEKLSQM